LKAILKRVTAVNFYLRSVFFLRYKRGKRWRQKAGKWFDATVHNTAFADDCPSRTKLVIFQVSTLLHNREFSPLISNITILLIPPESGWQVARS